MTSLSLTSVQKNFGEDKTARVRQCRTLAEKVLDAFERSMHLLFPEFYVKGSTQRILHFCEL